MSPILSFLDRAATGVARLAGRIAGMAVVLWAAYGASTFLSAHPTRPPLTYWLTGNGSCWADGVTIGEGVLPACKPLPEVVDL